MTSDKEAAIPRQPSAIGFAIVGACLLTLVTFVSILLLPTSHSALEIVLSNAAIAGFGVSLPYGLFYNYETRLAGDKITDLILRVKNGDKEATQLFAALTACTREEWPHSAKWLIMHTLMMRAKIYFTIWIILIVVVGIWIGQETSRQEGRIIWEWQSIAWQWP